MDCVGRKARPVWVQPMLGLSNRDALTAGGPLASLTNSKGSIPILGCGEPGPLPHFPGARLSLRPQLHVRLLQVLLLRVHSVLRLPKGPTYGSLVPATLGVSVRFWQVNQRPSLAATKKPAAINPGETK